ncbi:hypothetical protein KEM55_001240 [Ascosphaera atra]|nr:hypothetical protein KEM55_001240 [Ascosphaera atra]
MATVNVRRDVTDPFYRYKMERLQAKIEGKGNGIKTVIVNLNTVAQAVGRPPAYLIKYFGFELGAQANAKPADNDRWIINGAHDAAKLQDYLDGFISRFVLCKKCKNPETVFIIKDGRIIMDCKACGQRSECDNRHKLAAFILKNEAAGAGKKGSTKKERREKKSRRDRNNERQANGTGNASDEAASPNGEDGSAADEDEAPDAGSDDEFTRRIQSQAQAIAHDKEIADDEWAVDVSAEAVAARAKELPSDLQRSLVLNAANGDADEDEEEGGETAYDVLGSWILEAKAEGKTVEDIEVYRKMRDLGIEGKHKSLTVLAQTLFDGDILKKNQVAARAGLLKKLVADGGDKHARALLGGIERLVGSVHPELLQQVSKILLALYQEDVLEEEALKSWGKRKASKKYVDLGTSKKVRKSAEPFLVWLEEAESEGESEEEESE